MSSKSNVLRLVAALLSSLMILSIVGGQFLTVALASNSNDSSASAQIKNVVRSSDNTGSVKTSYEVRNGADGKDGANGKDGEDGAPGLHNSSSGVSSIHIETTIDGQKVVDIYERDTSSGGITVVSDEIEVGSGEKVMPAAEDSLKESEMSSIQSMLSLIEALMRTYVSILF